MGRSVRRGTYAPLVLVKEVLGGLPASVEK